MLLPCTHFKPDVITLHFDESIIIGTRAMSGSAAIILRKVTISFSASNRPSSILISIIKAPSATCFLAIPIASSYCCPLINRRNFLLPATLHRSPTFTKPISGVTFKCSSPDNHIVVEGSTTRWGHLPFANAAYLAIKVSVVPQQPPMIFTNPSSINSAI